MTVDFTFWVPTAAYACTVRFGISTVRVPHVHDSTPIFNGKAVGQPLGHYVPVAGGEARLKALIHSACRVFQGRRTWMQFLEARERGVEIGLIEYFTAVEQVAFECEQNDFPPFGIEALLRCSTHYMGDDSTELAQPMHGLDIGPYVGREIPCGAHVCGQFTGRERSRSSVIDAHAVRCHLELSHVRRCVRPSYERPCSGVDCRFAGEVAGIEFRDGGVEVVGVEGDERRGPPVGVELADTEDIGAERIGSRVAARGA